MGGAERKRMSTDRERLDFLDGIRGIAILWVVLHHAYYFFEISRDIVRFANGSQDQTVKALLLACAKTLSVVANYGAFGVDLFFVISGFLITGLLADFLQGGVALGRFYLRRIFKIVPHYYFMLAVFGLVFWIMGRVEDGTRIVPYFFFFQNFGAHVVGMDHTWSLVVEEQFYIFWALALFLISRRWPDEGSRWRMAVCAAVGFLLAVFLNRYLAFAGSASLLNAQPAILQTTSYRADGLMAGCLLRLAWVRYPALFRDKSRAVASYLIGTAIFMYLLSLPITNYGQQVYWYTTTLAWGMACCFVLAGLGGADWLWRASWLRFIGRHSYGIYLLHHPLVLVMFFLSKGHPTWLFWIYIPLAIGAGVISTMTVEKYFLEMRKRLCP